LLEISGALLHGYLTTALESHMIVRLSVAATMDDRPATHKARRSGSTE
jgi:hypothetical protein